MSTQVQQPARSAEDVARGLKLSDAAKARLKPGQPADLYFDDLTRNGLEADAVRVLARLATERLFDRLDWSGAWQSSSSSTVLASTT